MSDLITKKIKAGRKSSTVMASSASVKIKSKFLDLWTVIIGRVSKSQYPKLSHMLRVQTVYNYQKTFSNNGLNFAYVMTNTLVWTLFFCNRGSSIFNFIFAPLLKCNYFVGIDKLSI